MEIIIKLILAAFWGLIIAYHFAGEKREG